MLALSFSAAPLGTVIGNRQGLGQTGDVLIVGSDGLARSDSAFTAESDVLQPTLFDGAVAAAVTGLPGTTSSPDFRGASVIAAAAPADVTSAQSWAVVAVMDRAEIFAPVTTLTTLMLATGLGLLVVVALAGWVFARGFSRPITP